MGQPLVWFDDVEPDSPYFDSAQFAAAFGLIELHPDSLNFGADEVLTGKEVGAAIRKLAALRPDIPVVAALAPAGGGTLEWSSLARVGHGAENKNGAIKRGDFVKWLMSLGNPAIIWN